MTYPGPARTSERPPRPGTVTAAILVVVVVVLGVVSLVVTDGAASDASARPSRATGPVADVPRGSPPDAAADEDDGVVPDGTTIFDDVPAVARLDPGLLASVRRAAADAGRSGIGFSVNSGWRSPRYQEQLLREAVATYGSEREAARWVATADTSPHVSGDAVDIGPAESAAWLSAHGAGYGLCRVYRNEPWHFELRPAAVHSGCPPLYADPTDDPRMRE
ncbi:peptidase M15B and M15C DD-carboxypeptidase VanY/endolysin [Pseudonocardia dioxanivorans CB1190]|uniref:Peptidase M15B and M15C DD-carboxypeptidase VanY/endolysin n=1 Tax=Pseudonocardia dioxanivorans (strain ATCC 55486 / DSM 44775 / JCM 13855 / CB1190) TaxID=675635 RepID=F4CTK1_PSEUX|nr:M15 family metallopeptidase [Pseudonocardia dioxanivorans]AEA28504.1 peptidase M15B and M15C DD-carboxypeptidase VanY/endolysin [Pseudonocardia dioxanivorans CB1190]